MARTLTPRDISALMNAVVKEATGQTGTLTAENLSDFVSVGETVLATGIENTLNALSLVIGRTIVAVRPYDAKLKLISAIETGEYAHRLRKISFFAEDAMPAGDWNTQLYTNLQDGFTNGQNPNAGGTPQSTKSMWEQNVRIPLEMNFGGSSVWQTSVTIYKYQVKQAFRSPEDFATFVSGIMTQVGNEIEMQKEAFNRIALLNYIGGLYDIGTVVNLTQVVNTMYGTSYTTSQILTAHRTELLTALVTEIKKYSRKLTDNNSIYHWNPTRSDGRVIWRHTPRADQKLIIADDFMIESEAMVLPAIFNDQYLKIENFERVGFWQNLNDPLNVNIVPAIPAANGSAQTTGTAVETTVVGVLFDRDALLTDWQIEDADTTPLESRKKYYNTWYSFAKNAINDFSENGILFVLEDAGA